MIEREILEQRFHNAMVDLYVRRLREIRYNATRLHAMIKQYKGVEAAKHIISIKGISSGLDELYHANRLDLSVQWLMLDPQYTSLFSVDELRTAWDQLAEVQYPLLKERPRP